MSDTSSLAEILTERRELLGWSLEEAAAVTGFLPEFIQYVETGRIKLPALESLSVFALAYEIPMDVLLAARQKWPPLPLQ